MNDVMVPVPDNLWQEANEHTSRGNFDKAIEIYKYILIRYGANNLANEFANARLADILYMIGQSELAEDHIRKALNYNPENPDYHCTLGVIYYTRFEWEKAVTTKPDDIMALAVLKKTYVLGSGPGNVTTS